MEWLQVLQPIYTASAAIVIPGGGGTVNVDITNLNYCLGNGAYGDRETQDPATIDNSKKGSLFKLENVDNFLITNIADQFNAGATTTTGAGSSRHRTERQTHAV